MVQQRFVFYFSMGTCTQAMVRAASKTASSLGATVIKAGLGTMLVEAAPAVAAEVGRALPHWRYAKEQQAIQLPESGPLQRTRQKLVAKKAAAKG